MTPKNQRTTSQVATSAPVAAVFMIAAGYDRNTSPVPAWKFVGQLAGLQDSAQFHWTLTPPPIKVTDMMKISSNAAEEQDDSAVTVAVRNLKKNDIVFDDFWGAWRSVDFIGPGDYAGHIRLVFRGLDSVQMPSDYIMAVLNKEMNTLPVALCKFVVDQQIKLDSAFNGHDRFFVHAAQEGKLTRIFKSQSPRQNDAHESPTTFCFIDEKGDIYLPTQRGTAGKRAISSVYTEVSDVTN